MVKKVMASFLCLILLINYFPLTYASAEVDNQIPTVQSIEVTPIEAKVGDTITIKAKITDSSGVKASKVELKTPSKYSRDISLNFNSESGLWEGTYQVKSTDEPGTWTSSYMYLSDYADNYGSINPSLKLTVDNTGEVDNQIPTVQSIEVTPLEANVGDTITIKAKITDSSGVNASKVELKTPSKFIRDIKLNFNSESGLWEGTYQVKSTDEPGTWTSSYMYLSDDADNYGSINPSLKFTVENTGEVDNQIPTVQSIEVTPLEANVGDTITIKAKITDNSGVKASKVELKTPSKFIRGIWLDFNSKSGLWEGTYQVKSTDELGTWTSSYMYLSDDADNYGSINPSLKFNVLLDNTPPEMPNINEVTDQLSIVTGTAEAGSLIMVKAGTTLLGTGNADAKDKYTVAIPKQKAGIKLTITATDRSGNVSEAREVTVKDVTAPSAPTVNEVTENSTNVQGVAESGSTIIVKAGTTLLGTGNADAKGNYIVAIPKQKAGIKFTVTAADRSGNVSEAREVTVKDVTAPSAPTVNEVTDNSTNVQGVAESGSTIIVKAGTTLLGTGNADAEGKYIVAIPEQKAGTKLTVTATDNAGNVSEVKEVIVKDVTAPALSKVNEVTETSTSVVGTAEAGSTITVKAGTIILGTATANTEGKYSVTTLKQKAGTKLTVTATDNAGNVSEVKEVIVKDVTAPGIPTVNAIYDNATAITGKAETNAKVYVMIGSKKIGEATAKNGAYTIKIAKQKAGTSVTVYAVDTAGNKSGSKTVKVIDKTPPSVPTVNAIYNYATTITGKAETNAKVYVMIGSKKIGEATAKNGAYTIKIAKQKAGTSVTVYAVDPAGNKSGSKTVKVIIDKTPPSVPAVNAVYDNVTSITGKAESNAKVYAMVGNKRIGEATAKNGVYTIKIAKQKAGTSISVYAVDPAGNKSRSKTVKVIDKTPPSVPTVNKITSKTVTVTGKGEKGASIYIYNGSKKIGQGIVDSRGNYKVKIKAQMKGSTLKVHAQDKSGNKSKSNTIKVS